MARPTNLRVSYTNEATVNMGNFENQKPGFTVSGDVPEGTSPTEAKNELVKLVDAWLEQEILSIKGK